MLVLIKHWLNFDRNKFKNVKVNSNGSFELVNGLFNNREETLDCIEKLNKALKLRQNAK